MTDFAIVAIVLGLFLGFGIAMGVLMVSAFSRRRAYRYLEGDDDPRPPPEPPGPPQVYPPWYGR
jgi:hypothetical protein